MRKVMEETERNLKNQKKEKDKDKDKTSFFSGNNVGRSRKLKILLACLILLLLLALLLAVVIWLPVKMFAGNDRFTLMQVKLSAHQRGYWKNQEKKICQIMNVEKGKDNLFSFHLQDLANKLRARPSIEDVVIARILPDTLFVKIMEREPRALVNSPRSPYILDAGGILMLQSECMDISSSLPVISGIDNLAFLKIGEKVPGIAAPMELLRVVKTKWPDIRIERVLMKKDGKGLLCVVRYKSFPELFRVEMPRKNMEGKVRELATALDRIVTTASTKRNINLMYENRAVLTDLPGRKKQKK